MAPNSPLSERALSTLETALLSKYPAKFIVLQYDNVLACLKSAIRAVDRNDIEARCNSINAAIEIISELYLWLDRQNGGDLAENLATIYGYMIWKLPEVNFRNDRELAMSLMKMMKQLRSSWVKVDSKTSDALIKQSNDQEVNEIAQNTKVADPAAFVA